MCLAFYKALFPSNIEKRFQKIEIWPFNSHTVHDKMGCARAFIHNIDVVAESFDSDDKKAFDGDNLLIQEVVEDTMPKFQLDGV